MNFMTKMKTTEERKASVAKIAESATGKVRKGIAMIDFRQPTPAELSVGERLSQRRLKNG